MGARVHVVSAVAVGAFALAACGGGSTSSVTPKATPDAVVRSVPGVLKFDQTAYTVPHGDDVTFEYVNDDSQAHTLVIDGVSKSKFKLTITSKNDKKVGAVALAAGSYTLYCDLPGHRSAGMEAKLTVS